MPEVLFFLLFVVLISFTWGALSCAPWVPTMKAESSLLVDNLKISPSATIYDLGCGTGSILFAFADKYPEAKCIGYDVSLFPLFFGLLRKLRSPKKYKNISLRFGDLFKQHFADADLVVIFLMEKSYKKLFAKLTSEAKPGTIVALEAWPAPDREPVQKFEGEKLLPWYVYEIGEREN